MRGRKPELKPVDDDYVAAIPEPPDWLSEDAQAEWNRVYPILQSRKAVTAADLATLEHYCVAVGRAREAERLLKESSAVIEIDGIPKMHPAARLQSAAINQARQLAAELGLTPTSRDRSGMSRESETDDLFAFMAE